MTITPSLLEAYLKCSTKCWLMSHGEDAADRDCAQWGQTRNESYRMAEIGRLLSQMPQSECAISPVPDNLKAGRWQLATDVLAQTEHLESRVHAVERIPPSGQSKQAQFIPVRFAFTNKLARDAKLLLAFDALALSEMLGKNVSLGKIIYGDHHAVLKVKIPALTGEVLGHIGKITALLSSLSPPDLILNQHCAECEFQTRCRQKATEKDDLNLLSGMTEKERRKFHDKGIFTVTQLSHTFRPRRRPKRLRGRRERYQHSLRALALREKKIHIVGSPEFEITGTPVYLDVEGVPDRDFYYLIGVRVGNSESATYHSFWADSVEDEKRIWAEFLRFIADVPNPALIHYGSYETTFLNVWPPVIAYRRKNPRPQI
jgi:predicted RecB family nuclease